MDEYVPADGPLRRALLAVIDSDKPDSGEPDLLAELGLPQAQDSRSAPAKTEQHGMICECAKRCPASWSMARQAMPGP